MTTQAPSNAMTQLLAEAARIVSDFANHHPKWVDGDGGIQDPWGAHAWVERHRVLTQYPAHEPCPECAHKDAYYAQFDLTPKGSAQPPPVGPLKLDTDRQVFFYEQDHYYLSNFSSFAIFWCGKTFLSAEHAYHWARFNLPDRRGVLLQDCVLRACSAHAAFRFAQENKSKQREDWDAVKVDHMRDILREKVEQHEYVRRKLLETGDRELVENSWRDPFWGWGENRDGQNMLGKVWMEIRAELRAGLTKRSDAP